MRTTFGEDADLYDRCRPEYPAGLFDDLADLAGLTDGSRVSVAHVAGLGSLVRTMVSTGATKLALGNQLAATGGMTPVVQATPQGLRSAVAALLDRAQRAGAVRGDVTVDEVYLPVRALAQVSVGTEPALVDRAADVVLAGLATRHPPL